MIPWILIILGALSTLLGVLGLISIPLLPFFERFEIVYDKDKEIIQARTDPEVGREVFFERRHLIRDYIVFIVAGVVMFFTGFYIGYSTKGENFWLYKKLFPSTVSAPVWDELNENGQYVASSGKAYTYYILVSGNEVSLSGLPCEDLEELKNRLSEVRRENTVIVIDSFAVASTYRAVENMLMELGMDYEETQ